ncbi:hypothetical protein [Desertivirga arenae]|uniref:hypothetical protein n=1 Tax=Desertivirga arenae TaxID=2810309 RepID=UPI001A9594A0|nr:hypothetical protein [Pedobacter sp. SYSU D00823]
MIRRIISKLLFHAYAGVVGTSINDHLKKIRDAHTYASLIKKEDIQIYLSKWGYNYNEWNSLPLMTKKDISGRLPGVNPSSIHSYAYTGGSYGEPFKLPYSKERAGIRTASFAYFNEIAGYSLGDPFLLIAAKEKPKWWQFLRNEYRFVPKDLSEQQIAETVKLLCDQQIKVIIGFPSVVYELAAYIAENKIDHPVNAIIFTSEPTDETKRKFIKRAFGCRVTDRYSNEEVGLIAQQREFGGVYYTNRYNVLVEILGDDNLPVAAGEAGKVVVTDLKADLVPIVRYDTGDIAVAHEYKEGQLMSLSAISGRTTEMIYNAEGNSIAALSLGPLIHKPLTERNFYNQFQFAQVGEKHYELRVKSGTQIPVQILDEIKGNLLKVLGVKAIVDILMVEDIKPQKSGKRPIYKNEWKRQ